MTHQTLAPPSYEITAQAIEQDLTDRHGPLLGNAALHQALGYPSAAAFGQAIRRGTAPVPVFSIPGRRGRFALTRDVAIWLAECRANAMSLTNPAHPTRKGVV